MPTFAHYLVDYCKQNHGLHNPNQVAQALKTAYPPLHNGMANNPGSLAMFNWTKKLAAFEKREMVKGIVAPVFEYEPIAPEKVGSKYRLSWSQGQDRLQSRVTGKRGVYAVRHGR